MMQISRIKNTVPATVRAAKGPSLLAHKIVSENHLQGFQQLLSLACGIALDEDFMVGQCDISILGVDLDDEILSDAKKKETDRLTFMKHDVTQPFPFTSIYDCVYSRNLLHYFNKKQQRYILENIFNVLKPNGLFVFQLKAKSYYFQSLPDRGQKWEKIDFPIITGVFAGKPSNMRQLNARQLAILVNKCLPR